MIAPQVMNLMRMARGMGLGEGDSCSIIRVYETALNEEVQRKGPEMPGASETIPPGFATKKRPGGSGGVSIGAACRVPSR